MAKEVLFYGKKIEELKELSLEEFAVLLKSRARRSVIRRREEIQKFLQLVNKKIKAEKTIRTHNRNMIITPKLVGLTIDVYNGKEFIPVNIRERMLGHYLGEFALTRKRITHNSPGIGATRSSAGAKNKPK